MHAGEFRQQIRRGLTSTCGQKNLHEKHESAVLLHIINPQRFEVAGITEKNTHVLPSLYCESASEKEVLLLFNVEVCHVCLFVCPPTVTSTAAEGWT